ncbi:hypothetical protein [Choristoneura rosaceana nucleopolyhedrovirus]|uniref:Transmembrane protein n=1 Tax=Choristoneura rosaceana nucleopolyhedrovirus TaxID=58094 RepID=S5MR85_9ABAC|nr:hypothetical protein [Choristoneura rosaceana nucleopolyhedrovirus]AGR57153.1 hypothetical protein [Choristoneura rosaceana nucleopolyhedrovirus]
MIPLIARRTPEPELQVLIINMLATLPTLTLLLCSPQMIVQDCVGANGAWINGTLQSTAVAHATMHTACVAFIVFSFSLGLLLDMLTTSPPLRPAAITIFCSELILVAAIIKFCAGATVGAGVLFFGRLQATVMDDAALLSALYVLTALSVLHVARWLFSGWATECHEPYVATAVVTVTLYVIALTLASLTVCTNGLQMFRNASVAFCKLNNGTWSTMSLPNF